MRLRRRRKTRRATAASRREAPRWRHPGLEAVPRLQALRGTTSKFPPPPCALGSAWRPAGGQWLGRDELGTAIAAPPKVAEFPWRVRPAARQALAKNQPSGWIEQKLPWHLQAQQWGPARGCPLRSRFGICRVAALKSEDSSAPPGNGRRCLKRQLAEPPSCSKASSRIGRGQKVAPDRYPRCVRPARPRGQKQKKKKGPGGPRPAGFAAARQQGLPGGRQEGGLRGASGLRLSVRRTTAGPWTAESGSRGISSRSDSSSSSQLPSSIGFAQGCELDHCSRNDRWRQRRACPSSRRPMPNRPPISGSPNGAGEGKVCAGW